MYFICKFVAKETHKKNKNNKKGRRRRYIVWRDKRFADKYSA